MSMTASTTRRTFAAALAASLLPLRALADEAFPVRPVKFVNWSNPGGNLDLFGRILGDQAGRMWGQAVVTDNKPGASGIIATDYVAKSAPDGDTVLITSSTGQLTNALTKLKLPFDPVKDFEPLSLLAAGNIALYARADAPFNNLQELVEYAKKSGKPLSYGSFGLGTSAHLYGEALVRQANIRLVHVPYKTGELGAMNDVIGGSLDLSFFSQGTAKVHGTTGKLKLLAISGPQRTKILPNLPTFGEQGFKGFGMAGWIAAYAPAHTPRPVVAKLSATMREAIRQPEPSAKLEALGYDLIGSTPEELMAFYQEEYKRFAELVQVAGIKPE